MKLVQARTRGLGPVIESCWFELSPQLNLFHFTDLGKGTRFFEALQTINPPFNCAERAPFVDFPRYLKQQGQTRRIHPEKRTTAFGVFAAPPGLVMELGEISPLLYETDRIEVGRRQDYSRWLNFVELAFSSRWSEVAVDIKNLSEKICHLYPDQYARLQTLTGHLPPTARITNQLAEELIDLLAELKAKSSTNLKNLLERVMEKARRQNYFKKARETVYQRLPLLVMINKADEFPPTPKGDIPLTAIEKSVDLAIETGRNRSGAEAILLFVGLETMIGSAHHSQLADLILTTSKSHQCLYLSGNEKFLNSLPTAKLFRDKDLLSRLT